MGIEEWLDFMPRTVTIDSYISRSVSGRPNYANNPTTYQARVEIKNHVVLNKEGDQIIARGRVYLATTDIPTDKDLLTLPAGFVPRTPPIISVNVIDDDQGVHHVTLEIG